MHDWPGRAHVELLRVWPDLVQTVERIQSRPDLFAGAVLLGSLSRGEGDAISDVDIVAVTNAGEWQDAWDARHLLSSGALVTFDRYGDRRGVAGHFWLTTTLVLVECLIAERGGGMRLAGDVVVLLGEQDLTDDFERIPPFTREDIDTYAAELRERNEISEIERAYGDLIALLRREVRATPN
jgi:hypothetical protein